MRGCFIATTPLALLCATAVHAQSGEPGATSSPEPPLAQSVANGPSGRFLASSFVPDIQFIASEDEKAASISWSFNHSSSTTQNRLRFHQLTGKIATAIDEPDSDVTVLGLSGFHAGTEIKINYTVFSGAIRFPAQGSSEYLDYRAVLRAAEERCRATFASSPGEDITAKCDIANGDPGGSVSSFIEKYGPRESFDRVMSYYFPDKPFAFAGIEVGGSQKAYKYLDALAFAEKKASHLGYSASIFGGALWLSRMASITGSFTYSRSYDAQDPIQLCQAINATQTRCITSPAGPPAVTHEAIGAIEGRLAFGVGKNGSAQFAIAPQFSYDVHNDAYAINVPFYLAGDGSGKLRAGVRFTYANTSDATTGHRTEDTRFGFFIGVPFSIFQ